MRIYLIGYMYSGKTTLGHRLATQTGYRFLDLDQLFEATFHTSIPIFFQRYGEKAFRQLEQKMLHSTAEQDNIVISTGGGTPCHFDNMEWINAHGISVFLDISTDTLLRRATASKKPRPVLANKTPEERELFVHEQLKQRRPYYNQAHITISSDSADLVKLAEQIKQLANQ